MLEQPVRKDEAAREAPREPGVPPHVGRHSREAELAVLQRELAIAVEVCNSRVLAYLQSDQLRDAPENRLHSAARAQPRAGGPCPVPTLRCACMRCAGGCLHADPGQRVREERTRARARERRTRSSGTLPCRCRAHTSYYAVHTRSTSYHAGGRAVQPLAPHHVDGLCSYELCRWAASYADTSYYADWLCR